MKEKNGKVAGWLQIFILLFCGVLLICDISHKKGYHMDELLSFELANAEFNPWIVPTQPQGRLAKFVDQELRGENTGETFQNLVATIKDVCVNRGKSKLLSYKADVYQEPVWITAQEFTDYITVGKQDGFEYLSVYFNVKDDNHPPLHFMLLHTVCSIFRGKITPLMGCSINLFFVLAMTAIIMNLVPELLKIAGQSKWTKEAGLLAGALYGLSAGAMNTTLLIRMYAMVSFFCIATLAIHVKKYFGVREKNFGQDNQLLGLVTVLGFWTQYFFLFYCLVLAAVTSLLLWKNKRIRECIRYVRTMIMAAVVGIAGFPFAIQDVFSSERGTEALGNLSAGFSGYGTRLLAFGKIAVMKTGWVMLLIALTAGVLFVLCRLFKKRRKTEEDRSICGELWTILAVPTAGYFLLAARMSPYLVDRYIMPLFPLCVILLVTGLGQLLCLEDHRQSRIFLTVLAGAMVAGQLFYPARYEETYLYEAYEDQEAISKEYREDACICIGQGVGYYENLLEFTHYCKTLILTPEQFENRGDKESIEALDQVVVLLKNGLDSGWASEIMEQQYGMKLQKVLQQAGGEYGDQLLLYQKEG